MQEVLVMVTDRKKRPSIPTNSPAVLAELMRSCWAEDPKKRPTMAVVQGRLTFALDNEVAAHHRTTHEEVVSVAGSVQYAEVKGVHGSRLDELTEEYEKVKGSKDRLAKLRKEWEKEQERTEKLSD